MWQTKHSQLDASVNFSRPLGTSIVECRFVQREPTQIIAYLSSHAGCLQACRFCHLTATGQTDETPVDVDGFCDQLQTVLEYWEKRKTGQETTLNINWMARGEPLNNPTIVCQWQTLYTRLEQIVAPYGLKIKANISTIMPKVFQRSLTDAFAGDKKPNIYYSLYSLNDEFRRRWLPKARSPLSVINDLKAFAEDGGNIVVHQAFIKNQNDEISDIFKLSHFIHENLPMAKINMVRYNPFSEKHGEESESLEEIQVIFEGDFHKVQLVPRVGEDVAASCGMFLNYEA